MTAQLRLDVDVDVDVDSGLELTVCLLCTYMLRGGSEMPQVCVCCAHALQIYVALWRLDALSI